VFESPRTRSFGGNPHAGVGARGLGASRSAGHEHARVGDPVARACPEAAEREQTGQQILRERAAWGHVRAGPGAGAARRSRSEDARRLDELTRRDIGPLRDELGRERLDVTTELFEVSRVLVDEVLVEQTLFEDDPHHAREHRGVFAGYGLKVDQRLPGGFAPARVDHDELDAPLQGAMQMPIGVDGGNPAQARHRRIRPDEEPRLRRGEGLAATVPAPVECLGEKLSRLIDRAAAERHG
jgi:hypothetical protein